MTAKEYLMRYRNLDAKIDAKLERITRLRALAEKRTATYSDMPRGGGADRYEIVARIADMERELDADIDRLLILQDEIKAGKVKKEEEGMYGSTVWKLSNGVRVVVKPSALEANKVQMKAYARGGTSMLDAEDLFTSGLLTTLLKEEGLGKFSKVELRKQTAGKSAKVDLEMGSSSTGLKGESSSKDIETMLQLAYLRFTAPRFDSTLFARMIEHTRRDLLFKESTAGHKFDTERSKMMFGEGPRLKRRTSQNLGDIDFNRMPVIYDTFFNGTADDYTFFFIGDFDIDALKPLVEKYIGGLPTKGAKLAWVDNSARRKLGVITDRFEAQMEVPKSTVYFNYAGPIDYTLENNMTMRLLSECLYMRYFQSIREERGGTYGVKVEYAVYRLPEPQYELKISFDTEPALVEELSGMIEAELRNIAENGPREEDVAKSIEYWLKMRPERLEKNDIWFSLMQDYYIWDQEWYAPWDAEVAAMSGEKVQALMRKILDDNNVVKIVMDPEQ